MSSTLSADSLNRTKLSSLNDGISNLDGVGLTTDTGLYYGDANRVKVM